MKGILFKPDMIQAIIEGRKTQTRRLGGLKEINLEPDKWLLFAGQDSRKRFFTFTCGADKPLLFCKPRYQQGETVYIREPFWFREGSPDAVIFKDGTEKFKGGHTIEKFANVDRLKFRSPMFLKAEYARYFITITDVRAERLQEITEGDIRAEGCPHERYLGWFIPLWNSINKDYPFESNPWVWVYTFRREK